MSSRRETIWHEHSSIRTVNTERTRRKTQRSGVDYRTLADLRYHIRRFLQVRESVARAAGVEPQHYLLLLQIKGLEGRDRATVGHLAERLQLRHHGTVELVNRPAARGLVDGVEAGKIVARSWSRSGRPARESCYG